MQTTPMSKHLNRSLLLMKSLINAVICLKARLCNDVVASQREFASQKGKSSK